MFSDPSSGDICNPRDVAGHLLIVRPIELRVDVPTQNYGLKDAIAVDICDLDVLDPASNQLGCVYRGSLWFNGPLIGSLKNSIGQLVLARMTQGEPKPGQSPPWVLEAVTAAADKQRAEQWASIHPEFANGQLAASRAPTASPSAAASAAPAAPAMTTVEITPETAALLEQLKAQQA